MYILDGESVISSFDQDYGHLLASQKSGAFQDIQISPNRSNSELIWAVYNNEIVVIDGQSLEVISGPDSDFEDNLEFTADRLGLHPVYPE